MNCPRCHVSLVPGRLAKHSIQNNIMTCEGCKGSFVGPEVLQNLELQQEASIVEFRRIPAAAEQQKSLSCPGCEVTMEKVTSERDAKVIMDLCPKCNHTWLDGGEIDAMRTESLLATLVGLFRTAKN